MVLKWLFGRKERKQVPEGWQATTEGWWRGSVNIRPEPDADPATEKQVAFLGRLGIQVREGNMTKGQATQTISSYIFAENLLKDEFGLEDPKPSTVNVVTAFILKDQRLIDFVMQCKRDEVKEPEEAPEYAVVCDYIRQTASER